MFTADRASSTISSSRRLDGKVVVITGGASGIGEATAKLFVSHGARVVIADVQDGKGRELCELLGPANASYVHCDVTCEADVERAVAAAVSGHGRLDCMFANAGILDTRDQSLLDCEKSVFERVIATNVVGAMLAVKHAARAMVPARRGSIVLMGSTAGSVAGMATQSYTCSKHAVVGLMKAAAAELGAHGVRVNSVSPHGLATPLSRDSYGMDGPCFERWIESWGNLKGVHLKAEDAAEAVLYLASDESRYVSGHNLVVDGGVTVARDVRADAAAAAATAAALA